MALFIAVEVDANVAADAAISQKLIEVCPVNIFERKDGKLAIADVNLDECTLCELCLNAAPAGSVRIQKLWGDKAVLKRAS